MQRHGLQVEQEGLHRVQTYQKHLKVNTVFSLPRIEKLEENLKGFVRKIINPSQDLLLITCCLKVLTEQLNKSYNKLTLISSLTKIINC
jgi:hypothetical protein